MTGRVRVAVLGAGDMGATHAAAWAGMDDVELAAVVARTPARVQPLAARLGVPARTDLEAVLTDDSIAAVDITLPTALHREVAVAALERGKHVLCETPLAANVADARAMIDAARRHGRLLQVAQLLRVATLSTSIRALLADGALGRPLVVSTERLWPGLDRVGDPSDHHGDALEELSLFDFDFLVWCFGPPRAVWASGRVSAERVEHVLTVLDFGELRGFVEASLRMPGSAPFRIGARVVCERGAIEWAVRFEGNGPPIVQAVRYPAAGEADPIDPGVESPYVLECRHFVRAIRGEADPGLLDGETALDGLRIVAAARESLARGARVALA